MKGCEFEFGLLDIAMKKEKCPHCLKDTATQICEHCLNDITQGDDMSDFRRELRLAMRIDDFEKVEKVATFINSIKKDDSLSLYMLAYLNYVKENKHFMFQFLSERASDDLDEIMNHALIHIEEIDRVLHFINKNKPSFQLKEDLPIQQRLALYDLTEVKLTTPKQKRNEMGKMQLILGFLLLIVLGLVSINLPNPIRYFYSNLMFIIPSIFLSHGVVNLFVKNSKKVVVLMLFFLIWYVISFLFLIRLQEGALDHLIQMLLSLYEFFKYYVKRAF